MVRIVAGPNIAVFPELSVVGIEIPAASQRMCAAMDVGVRLYCLLVATSTNVYQTVQAVLPAARKRARVWKRG
jgi:hypothetical protein